MSAPVVGVLCPYLSGPYNGAVLTAVIGAASSAGAKVVAVQTAGPGARYHEESGRELVGRVAWDRVDGIVAVANAVPPGYLEQFRHFTGKPVVAIGNAEGGTGFPAVMTDNRGGVRRAVEHLLAHGHEQVAFAGCLDQFDIRERYESYRATLRDNGTEPDSRLFFETGNNVELGGSEAAHALMASGVPVTAVLAGTDLNAVGLMSTLKKAGWVLPQDLAIVGFDDMPASALQSPRLSSVSQNFDQLGRAAFDLVARLIRGEVVAPGPHVLPSSFIARESCGCAEAEVLPAATGQSVAECVEVLLAALDEGPVGASGPGRSATGVAGPASGQVDKLTAELVDLFEEAAARDLAPARLLRVGQLCQDLYACRPVPRTVDALFGLVARLAEPPAELVGEERWRAGTRLDRCVTEVRLGVNKAAFGPRNDAYYRLRAAMRTEYDITLDLLGRADEHSLAWLKRTGARFGLLALWPQAGADRPPSGGPGDEELELVGSFAAPGRELSLGAPVISAEQFPPEELFRAAGEDCSVCVFPVKSMSRDWGFLAIADPMASSFIGQDFVFMWSALFGEALDHALLMRSLSQRSEDLARSYEREREMARAVRESEQRYALAAQAANDGLWDWDLETGSVYYSPRWKEMLGFAGPDIGDGPEEWLDRVVPDDRHALLAELSALKTGDRVSLMSEHRVRAGDGSVKWALCRCRAVPGLGAPATRIVGSLTDVTERRQLEERLRHQALYDSLTGLPNRVLFMDRLSEAVAQAKSQEGYGYSVLWLDIDNFKNLNDSLGHQFGDKLLVVVAERLRGQLRGMDMAARFGGDEFAVMLLGTEARTAVERVARRILDGLAMPYQIDGHEVVVTASLGVAEGSRGYESPEDVLRDADIAMYEAKAARRGSYAIFRASMYEDFMARINDEGPPPGRV